MSTEEKRDFNLAAKIILGLTILSLAIGTITSFQEVSLYSKMGFGGSQTHRLVEAIMNILMIGAAIMIFVKKRIGLIAFITLGVIRMFATIPSGTDVSTAYYLGGKTVLFLRDVGIFALALCFRKNGISGWKAFFADDEYIDTHFVEKAVDPSNTSSSYIQNCDSPTQEIEHQTVDVNECDNCISDKAKEVVNTVPETPEVAKLDIDEGQPPLKQRKPLNLRVLIPLVLGAVFVLLFALILFKSYPKNFDSFGDKFKYFFGLSNNGLSQKMFDAYKHAQEAGFDETSYEYLTAAYLAKPNDLVLIDSIATNYFTLGVNTDADDSLFYARSIELRKQLVNKEPHNTRYKDQLIRSLYNSGDKASAYQFAESLLMDDPKNGLAVDVMCRKAYDEKNWKNLEKWGARGYELDSTTTFQAELAYFYSKGLYENGKRYEAQKIYEKAIKIDGKDRLRDIFTIVGGTPCRIKSIGIENASYDGTVINKAGTTIYDDKTKFLIPVVVFEPLRTGDFEFKIKLYANGKLQHGENEDSDYTYTYKTLLICDDYDDDMIHIDMSNDKFHFMTEKDTIHKKLGGWGSDEPGTWGAGGYRIEVWWENEKLTTYSFNIYSGFWHNLGYGNRFD